jgi:hypothetical protein
MARLEGAMQRGEDITTLEFAQKTSAECFTDWESGMFQQHNWITDKTNKWINDLKDSDSRFAKIMGHGLSWDVAITKVPVNMMNEAIMEMTLGLPLSIAKSMVVTNKAKGIVRAAMPEIKTKEQRAEFKKRLSEELSNLDKDQAAQILRMFRHGGFGLGILGLGATLMTTQFGGWHHLGQTNDDKKRKAGEAKTGEIILGDTVLNEYLSGAIEHTNAIYPFLAYKAMLNTYKNDKSEQKSTKESATDMIYTEFEHVLNSYPQTKIINPLSIAKEIYRTYPAAGKKAIETYSDGLIKFEKESKIPTTPETEWVKSIGGDIEPSTEKELKVDNAQGEKVQATEAQYKQYVDKYAEILNKALAKVKSEGVVFDEKGAKRQPSTVLEKGKTTTEAQDLIKEIKSDVNAEVKSILFKDAVNVKKDAVKSIVNQKRAIQFKDIFKTKAEKELAQDAAPVQQVAEP